MATSSSSSIEENNCKKKGLLIGNNDYKIGNKLEYNINNVNDLKIKLEEMNFEIKIGINLTGEEIELIIEEFVKNLNENDLIIFYFGGYSINYNNINYLIGINDNLILNIDMIKYECIELNKIILMINNINLSGSIYLFDCLYQYNLFNLNNGLIPINNLLNTFIMFNSNSNKTILYKTINSRNTIFTFFILKYIQINLSIEQLFDFIYDQIINQSNHQIIPFKLSSIKKNLFFNYQNQSEINEIRSILIKKLILNNENKSLIDLRNKQLNDYDMKIIVEECFYKKSITKLWLNQNKITSIGAFILSSALINNNCLERINLNGNPLTDIGIKYLSKSLYLNKTLKILDLQKTEITDLSIEYLIEMIYKNKTLISLSLDYNLITDKGLNLLFNTFINSNSSIQFIGLSNNHLITDISFDIIKHFILINQNINEITLYNCNLSKLIKENIKKIIKTKKNISIYLNNWNE